MKKGLILLLCAALIFVSLTACGEKSDEKTDAVPKETQAAAQKIEEPSADTDITIDSLMTYPVSSEEDFSFSDYTDGTVYISDYLGEAPVVVIPDTLGGKPVSYISHYAFQHNSDLTAVKMADTITELDADTFALDSELRCVILGSSIEELPKDAFLNCDKLEQVRLNDGLKVIGEMCFYGCNSLSSIYIPESVEAIEGAAFSDVGGDFVIEGKAGSYAETYAAENDIPFQVK